MDSDKGKNLTSVLIVYGLLLFTVCNRTMSQDVTTVTDQDSNVYSTVKIGNHTWMIQNLKTIRFNDGTGIPLITDNTEWAGRSAPAYLWSPVRSNSFNSRYGSIYYRDNSMSINFIEQANGSSVRCVND